MFLYCHPPVKEALLMLKNANGELSQPLSSNPGSLLGVKTCVQLQPGGVPAIVFEVKSFEIHSE